MEKEIELVNGCFMGIYLEEGNHQVIMKFRPYDFYLGITISFLYLVMVIVCGYMYWRKRTKVNAIMQIS